MAKKKGKKDSKKERKAAKKEKKAVKRARKEARRLAKEAKRAAERGATKPATKARPARGGSPRTPVRRAPRRKPTSAPEAAPPQPPALKERLQPESLRLRSVGPSFTVNDVRRSLVFYRDVLGFTVKEMWEEESELRGVELVAGAVSVWLSQDDWKKGRDRAKGQGFRVYATTTQDVDALAARVRAAGGTLLEEPSDRPWGGRDFAVVDPDGFTLTIARAE